MKVSKLENGQGYMQTRLEIYYSVYDAIALAGWAIAHKKNLSRKDFCRWMEQMTQNHGIMWFVKAKKKFLHLEQEAKKMVESLFPEMVNRPRTVFQSTTILN